MDSLLSDKTVGEWVRERPSRSRVFEQFGIDYCCGGKKPLSQACQDKGLALENVLAALDQSDVSVQIEEVDWSQRTLSELCDHIIDRHHEWLRRELPRIEFMAQKVARGHGERHPEMLEVLGIFDGLKDEMMMHMRKEEEILFPLIREMERTSRPPHFHCGNLGMPIGAMEVEHETAGRALEAIRRLTNGFLPPAEACNTFRALLSALEELETDMHRHVHKENSILFPAAQRLEYELSCGS
jgi:regulator of cell morphogenesis and NO signaling